MSNNDKSAGFNLGGVQMGEGESGHANEEHVAEVLSLAEAEQTIQLLKDKLKAAEEKAKAADAKAEEERNRLLRLGADTENQLKRMQIEAEKARNFANEKLVKDLLDVVDNFERGLASFEADKAQVLFDGMHLTLKILLDALKRSSVDVLDPKEKAFDPEFHQAMSTQPTQDCAPNQVLTVLQKGYTLSGRLIRPALVVISTAVGS